MRRERRLANLQKLKRMTRNVEVQIDELILRDFPVTDRYAIGDALSSELSQLMMNAGEHSFAGETHIPVHHAGEITIPPNAKPDSIGKKVAQVIQTGLDTVSKGGHS